METWKKQTLLAYLEYLPYEDIDDIWGEQTQKATEAFQRDYQITVDGIFGNGTLARILEVIHNREEPASPVVPDISVGGKKEPTGTFWDEIEFFTREEFRCKCGGKYCNGFPAEPDETLVRLVNDLRKQAGSPAIPSSGLRCEQWNAIQNGAATSRHKRGKALDFYIKGVSGSRLLAMAQADPRTRYAYIIDGQWVHVDVE